MEQTKYLNEEGQFNPEKDCCFCGNSRGMRKHNVYFAQNRKAKICVVCEQKFDSSANVVQWCERNAVYSKTGKLTDFKNGGNPNA